MDTISKEDLTEGTLWWVWVRIWRWLSDAPEKVGTIVGCAEGDADLSAVGGHGLRRGSPEGILVWPALWELDLLLAHDAGRKWFSISYHHWWNTRWLISRMKGKWWENKRHLSFSSGDRLPHLSITLELAVLWPPTILIAMQNAGLWGSQIVAVTRCRMLESTQWVLHTGDNPAWELGDHGTILLTCTMCLSIITWTPGHKDGIFFFFLSYGLRSYFPWNSLQYCCRAISLWEARLGKRRGWSVILSEQCPLPTHSESGTFWFVTHKNKWYLYFL